MRRLVVAAGSVSSAAKSILEKRNPLDFLAARREVLPISLIVIYIIYFSIFHSRVFLNMFNISSILLELSVPIMLVTGISIVLISGEIDLSIGYNVLYSSCTFGALAVLGVPVPLAILITVASGCLMGVITGILVTRFGVNSFIATLAAGLIFYGCFLYIFQMALPLNINGQNTLRLLDSTTRFAQFQLIPGYNFQIPILYSLIIGMIFWYLMTKTSFFAQYYYVGANNMAARLSGINSGKLKRLAFIISSCLASFGGVIMCGRLGMTGSTVGIGWEAQIITGAVIGGVSIRGGVGKMSGAYAGIALIMCINNGMRILNVNSQIWQIVYGVILLSAVVMDTMLAKRKIVG